MRRVVPAAERQRAADRGDRHRKDPRVRPGPRPTATTGTCSESTTSLRIWLASAVDAARLARAPMVTTTRGERVTSNYFSVLGVAPALGRTFSADDDWTYWRLRVVVISHAFFLTPSFTVIPTSSVRI